jgi:UDP-N-acetyl-D-glucosamine/UDP-N-acetyl-D-galactosamine dehydrogenase
MNIDTLEVINAAATKWNFLPFHPGLVGGHCIGVDPYYLTYKAEQLHYYPQVILSGRRINDDMSKFIVEKVIKKLIQNNIAIKGSKVAVLGLTFKEDCADTRNSKVFDVIEELKSYGVQVIAHDPVANREDIFNNHHIHTDNWMEYKDYIAIILCVAHDSYRKLKVDEYTKRLIKNGVLFDVKSILDKKSMSSKIEYCRL